MAHSFVFTCPAEAVAQPYRYIKAQEFVEFITYHVVLDNKGETVVGYVQFLFKRTSESLNLNLPLMKFMQSVNDPAVYSHFMVPRVCIRPPITHGTPRLKSYVAERGLFVLKGLKKKAKETLTNAPRKIAIKASLALLQGLDPNIE